LEDGSGLYNMRAREYDARLGRLTSRDPRNGDFERAAETLNPYVYALNNPQVFADPSGQFTVVEINVSTLIDATLDTLKNVAVSQAKKYLKDAIFKAVSNVILNELGNIYPPLGEMWKALKSGDLPQAGRNFEAAFKKKICGAIGADGPITKMLWFYPGIRPADGNVEFAGFNCPDLTLPKLRAGLRYPDFILSEVPPTETTGPRASGKSIVVGDVKLSGNSLYNQYVKSGPQNKIDQFNAITRYAAQGTYSRTAVFLTVFTGQKSKLREVQILLGGDGLKQGVAVVVVAAFKNKGFNDVE
jgi:RHS repeat-associated protein